LYNGIMLITSKFHDYYDTATAWGIDKAVVYRRETKSFKAERDPRNYQPFLRLPDDTRLEVDMRPSDETSQNRTGTIRIRKWIVGFCGNFYVMVQFEHVPHSWGGNTAQITDFFCNSVEEVQSYIHENITQNPPKKKRYRYLEDTSVLTEMGLKNLFDVSRYTKFEKIFQAYKTPVFTTGSNFPGEENNGKLTINPCLRKIRFMKTKDPATAFQEIYQYISGVLGVPSNPMVEVSDEVKAASRGHDGEYSFKKPPGGGQWR
jgi:hypothetical protein